MKIADLATKALLDRKINEISHKSLLLQTKPAASATIPCFRDHRKFFFGGNVNTDHFGTGFRTVGAHKETVNSAS